MKQECPVVWIVDDDPQVRESLQWLLETIDQPAIACPNAEAFLQSWQPGQWGVVLLDVRMPGRSGLELHRQLRQQPLTPAVIIMTGHADVHMAVQAMKEGAMDFFEKPFNDQLLLDAIQAALGQHQQVLQRQRQRQEWQQRCTSLTDREMEIMALLVQGIQGKQIAAQLGISPKTVDVHRHNLLQKLAVSSVSELIHAAISQTRENL